LSVALVVRIKPRAEKQIEAAAAWWSENRPAAPGAIRSDLMAAFDALVEQPGIGALVENSRDPETRRLYLARTRYFLYYRPRGRFLDVVAFWHSSREHGPKV
jgi:plasmid stabilization system protein ParE